MFLFLILILRKGLVGRFRKLITCIVLSNTLFDDDSVHHFYAFYNTNDYKLTQGCRLYKISYHKEYFCV